MSRRVVAMVLIRDGSKRIPDKAMRSMNGKPLALILLEKLKLSKYIDDIFITTSSERYAGIVKGWGFKVLPRPESLSADRVILADVMRHVAGQLVELAPEDYIIETGSCNPLGRIETIDRIIEHAHENDLDSCFAVKPLGYSLVDDEPVSSQDRKPRYCHFNFCRLRTKAATLEAVGWGYGRRHENLPVIEPWEQDIDNEWDWIKAEALLKSGYGREIKQ